MRRVVRVLGAHGRYGIGDEVVDCDCGICDAIDEGGISAVFQQPAHEVGEQGLMCADRGVDATGAAELGGPDNFLVQRLAHAVEALELVLTGRERLACHRDDRGEGLRVMGGELGEDGVRGIEQLTGASKI
jgi:hypothetical protein